MSSRNLTTDFYKKKVPKMTDSDILQGVSGKAIPAAEF
jgi:hypothetical protein